ncbi:sugar ABC transporter ATP-binding protein [Mesorhizobium sp. M3A.F.Ca.ET.080.04.2.1]|uniref:sugar ABC transporter ATP-binding protein n=1 Tax=Mesorhizobium sp. M3A.F.Ca.ET.080.04.2.1 TaxID=2493676 RepID=UPI000F759DB1|nr:sugar ABC transporter ATP-binding protein [Mesorhizobium sp. M3A.F.Ca.ET.080.04.2.1]AZO07957.1 sugar ABC transporter ATP-binding protein [Mesorhizobium sp. M3A.F.Ca.ET.080.04.2.1]RWF17824.1 MAG: sugar ABC transporter ATP-binding protein [Mesorhizobium sp.]
MASAAQALDCSQSDCVLEIDNVTKSFPGVLALDGVSLRIKRGTVHALMGENGAGKSTLMKIAAGIIQPDSGAIRLHGRDVRLANPLQALQSGIAMIHQELNLMDSMTVAENIWIRREPKNRLGLIDHAEMRRRTVEAFRQLEVDIDPDIRVGKLTVASQQMVEIAKAVSYESDVLIMDEPTSALTEREVGQLFRIIRMLRAKGKGIIYITHKMDELFEIADEVSVFRDGKYIDTRPSNAVTRNDVIRMMIGRELTQMFPKQTVPIGDVVLRVRDLCLAGVIENISFEVRAGEILGVAGLVGSGRSNIAETIFGISPATSGSIEVGGKSVSIGSPREAMKNGMALLTEDRKASGCFLTLGIQENTQMAALQSAYVRCGFVERGKLSLDAGRMVQTLHVKTPSMRQPIVYLSGGNQQKVLIGRWLLTNPKILILDEPTRGVDVGAKAEIHSLISRLAGSGAAVVMISSELPEVLGMSDRIMVVHAGRVTGILGRHEADQHKIMELASA